MMVALTSGNIGTLIRHRGLVAAVPRLALGAWRLSAAANGAAGTPVTRQETARHGHSLTIDGRLFGRFNLFDAMVAVLVLGLIPLGYGALRAVPDAAAAADGGRAGRHGRRAEPARQVKGENLRPYLRVSFGDHPGQRASCSSDTGEAEVDLNDMPPGIYDVVLYDSAQERSAPAEGADDRCRRRLPPTRRWSSSARSATSTPSVRSC